MKKFCGVLFLTVALLLAGSYDIVGECRDNGVYLGTFRDGYSAYLDVVAVSRTGNGFKAQVHAWKGQDHIIINYEFWYDGTWYFSNTQGFSKRVTSSTPVAQNLLHYLLEYY